MSLQIIKDPNIRDVLQKGHIQLDYIPSEQNPADVFTKTLLSHLHHHYMLGMGLRPLKAGK
jgi:hypothetical protein